MTTRVHVLMLGFCVALLCDGAGLGGGTAFGGPAVRYWSGEVVGTEPSAVVVKGGFRIFGGPQRWFAVHFRLLRDSGMPLRTAHGKDIVKTWNDLYTPDATKLSGPPSYTNIRVAVPYALMESAANLPKGRAPVWIVCALWDPQQRKYLGNGWEGRVALIITTNAAGRIVKTETFNVRRSFNVGLSAPRATLKARRCVLNGKHLKLRPGASVYQLTGEKNGVLHVGHYDNWYSRLYDYALRNEGLFICPIDTPEKALEFALLPFQTCALIQTRAQYSSVQ